MPRSVIKLNKLSRIYEMGGHSVRALQEVDLQINEGEFIAIMGRSGSGKSSLLNIIGFLDSPTSGRLEFEGQNVSKLDAEKRAIIRNQRIGFVFQSFNLLSRSNAYQNVEVPLIYRGLSAMQRSKNVSKALEIVGLADRVDHSAQQLSGGEQQRVALARALVCDPSIILADEPTGALDSVTAHSVMQLLKSFHVAGMTIVLVTHDHEVAAHAERIVTLRDGRIIDDTADPFVKTGHGLEGSLPLDEYSSEMPVGQSMKMVRKFTTARSRPLEPVGLTLFAGLRIALASLWNAKTRSALTALGIVIGVAAVITMVAVGRGAQVQVEQQINSLGAHVLLVEAAPRERASGEGRIVPLTVDDAVAIAQGIRGIEVAAPVISGGMRAVNGNRNRWTTVAGITLDYLLVREWDIISGRNFNTEEFRSPAKVGLIGATVAKRLFGERNPVGTTIRLDKVPILIIGRLAEKGQSPNGYDQDNVLLVPMQAARLRLLGTQYRANRQAVRYILAKVTSDAEMEPAQKEIKKLILERKQRRSANVVVQSLGAIFAAKTAASRSIAILLAAVASVSLVVGGISIMNIMLVSVSERTREIGLRLALGARPRDIRAQFMTEAIVLALIGGGIGISIGVGLATAIGMLADWPIIIEPFAVILAASFSGLVGIVFGYFPARRAARLDPIEALRVE